MVTHFFIPANLCSKVLYPLRIVSGEIPYFCLNSQLNELKLWKPTSKQISVIGISVFIISLEAFASLLNVMYW